MVSSRLTRRFPSPAVEAEKDWAGYGLLMIGFAVFILAFGFLSGAGNRLARLDEVDIVIATIFASFQLVHQVMFFFLGMPPRESPAVGPPCGFWFTGRMRFSSSWKEAAERL